MRRTPFQQIQLDPRGHPRGEFRGGSRLDWFHRSQNMITPGFERVKATCVRKSIAYGSEDRRRHPDIMTWHPGLQDSVWFEVLFGQLIELDRVKQARSRRHDRRRWIDHNHVELLRGALQITAAIIDDDAAFRM